MDKGWSINREDWEALKRALPTSNQWNSVLLTTNDETLVPAKPGVYAILCFATKSLLPMALERSSLIWQLRSTSANRNLVSYQDSINIA